VKHDAYAPNQDEKDERSGNVLTDQFVEKQLKVLNADENVEFALALLTSSKMIRKLRRSAPGACTRRAGQHVS
jgi:hypothetical protein